MNQNKYKKSAINTIDLQLLALKNLKKSLNSSFNKAVKAIGDYCLNLESQNGE